MPDKFSSNKGLTSKILNDATKRIRKVNALLHKTQFTGNYTYSDVSEILGRLKIDEGFYRKALANGYGTYKKKAYRRFQDGMVIFLFKASAPYDDHYLGYLKPNCIVETTDSNPEFLAWIDQTLPGLKVMSVEYTVDLHCTDSKAVNDLFYLLRRYAYVHHAKWVSMDGGDFAGWREDRETNAVYRINFQGRKSDGKAKKKAAGKYVKIYERGDDLTRTRVSKRTKQRFWHHRDTDRVRFEVTINRKNRSLAKNGIKTLTDLVNGPKFQEIIFPKSLSPTPIAYSILLDIFYLTTLLQ